MNAAITRLDEARLAPGWLSSADSRDTFNKRQLKYSQYSLPTSEGPLAGTLFWEYGKHVCFGVGVVNPVYITTIAVQATTWFGMAAEVTKQL